MNIKTQIEKKLGHEIMASKIAGVDYQYFDKDKKTFVNITIPDEDLLAVAKFVMTNKKLPLETQKARNMFFDYGGANVAKELHIGHLRSPIIGEALKRTFMAFGHKVFADTHLGDWGLQMGLVIAQLQDESDKTITAERLNEIYPKASKRSKENADFRALAEDITLKLQRKTQPYFDLWKIILDASMPKLVQNYKVLNCTFDTWEGEYKAQQFIPEILAKLQAKKLVREDAGCLIMDVKIDTDNKPMPPVILAKSNGGELYSTTDIGTIYYRQKENNPDEHVYVVDSRQELHLEQVFRVVKKGGLVPPSTIFKHVSYGTMNGTDGRPFKTRSGDTIKLEDVITLVTDAAIKKMRQPNTRDAQLIGIAALKFADLSNNVRKDYIFDIDKFTAFEGKTGPYLLYTVARINSIFKKAGVTPAPSNITVKDGNRNIIRNIIKLADAYTTATKTYSLNAIVDATYDLAAQFNLLYATESIQKSDDNLTIAALVRICLLFALDTLAITPVDEM